MGHFKRKENPQFTPPYSDITCGPFKKKKDTYRGPEKHTWENRERHREKLETNSSGQRNKGVCVCEETHNNPDTKRDL